MFLSDYAIVDRLPNLSGRPPKKGADDVSGSSVASQVLLPTEQSLNDFPEDDDRVNIVVSEVLLSDEVYTLDVIEAGFVSDRKGLLISGREEGSDLPCTEFLLIDVPEDVMEEIAEKGAWVFDIQSKILLNFTTVGADLIDA